MCTVQVDRAHSYFLCRFAYRVLRGGRPGGSVGNLEALQYCTDTEVVGSILGEVTRTGTFSHRMPI